MKLKIVHMEAGRLRLEEAYGFFPKLWAAAVLRVFYETMINYELRGRI
jgi:hypothetical protein